MCTKQDGTRLVFLDGPLLPKTAQVSCTCNKCHVLLFWLNAPQTSLLIKDCLCKANPFVVLVGGTRNTTACWDSAVLGEEVCIVMWEGFPSKNCVAASSASLGRLLKGEDTSREICLICVWAYGVYNVFSRCLHKTIACVNVCTHRCGRVHCVCIPRGQILFFYQIWQVLQH